MRNFKIIVVAVFCLLSLACENQTQSDSRRDNIPTRNSPELKIAAERFDDYLPLLEGKSIAVVANASSVTDDGHLVDELLNKGVRISKVFAPEHGFRGQLDAGETVNDEVDTKTGLPIFSLYGDEKKPTAERLSDVQTIIFDIQDVGVRFYTYLSTLHYVMESCAENDIPLIVLDRPNPNGFYVDGPVLKPEFSSFIGLHPVPIVYGMTIGEYARMINGEGWLESGVKCDLTVIKIANYSHDTLYTLPVKPSPNLPNMTSIYLYPSLALFEGTVVSIGRGTDFPFQVIGHPDYVEGDFTFTPRPVPGAMTLKLEGRMCRGMDLREFDPLSRAIDTGLFIQWLLDFYEALPDKKSFFLTNNFFDKLAGTDVLQQQIKDGLSAEDIKESWEADLMNFRKIREKYRLYK